MTKKIGTKLILLSLAYLFFVTGVSHARVYPEDKERKAELMKLFVEAPPEQQAEVKKVDMPKDTMSTGVFWFDNQRLIYSVRELGDWKADTTERSKIIIYNVDTNVIEETPYRGEVVCFGAGKEILIRDYPKPNAPYLLPGDKLGDDDYFLTGIFGGQLTRYKEERKHGLNKQMCRPFEKGVYKLSSDRAEVPLRDGGGLLDVPLARSDDKTVRLIWDGKAQWEVPIRQSCHNFFEPKFLPWLNQYFINAYYMAYVPPGGCTNEDMNSWLFSTNEIQKKLLPKLIQELRDGKTHVGGSGGTYWFRPGFFVTIGASDGFDGLYWFDEKNGLLKLILKKKWNIDAFKNISPDGCRIAHLTHPALIINVCKGK